jgi:hypothetical protein
MDFILTVEVLYFVLYSFYSTYFQFTARGIILQYSTILIYSRRYSSGIVTQLVAFRDLCVKF